METFIFPGSYPEADERQANADEAFERDMERLDLDELAIYPELPEEDWHETV